MADYNIDSILQRRLNESGVNTEPVTTTQDVTSVNDIPYMPEIHGYDKAIEVLHASETKVQELDQKLNERRAKMLAENKANENSIIRQFGLSDSNPVGWGINTATGVGKTAVDVAAWIAGAPATAWKATQPAISTVADLIPDPISNAYNKLNEALTVRSNNQTAKDLTTIFRDPAGLLDSVGKTAQKVVTPLYDTTSQDRLMGEIGQAYDSSNGALDTIKNVFTTAMSDPVTGAQLFITQLPYMQALAAKGVVGAAAYMGMVSDFTQQSITKYKESHGGAEPNATEMSAMLGTSIASVGIEKLESMFLLNKFKGAMPGNKMLTVPAKYGTGGITEFGQETTQNLLVDASGYQDKLLTDEALLKKSLREAVIAGGMGMASGSVGGAGMKAMQPSEEKLAQVQQTKEITAAVQQAVKTGDFTTLTDSKSPTYAPEAAVSSLFYAATREGVTPEAKQAHFDQANQVLSTLTKKAEILSTLTKEKPVAADKVAAKLSSNEEFITAANVRLADSTTTPETRSELEDRILEIGYENKTLTKRGRRELSAELKDTNKQLEAAKTQLAQFNQDKVAKETDVAKEVSVLTSTTTTSLSEHEITTSAHRMMKMAMVSPENIDEDTIALLSSDSNQDVNSRDFFRSFTAARVAINTTKDDKQVNKEIIFGSNNKKGIQFKGTNQYRKDFALATSTGNVKEASRLLMDLTNFMKDHIAKANMAVEVRNASLAIQGDSKQLIKVNDTWQLNKGEKLSETALKANGGLNLHYGSKLFVDGMQAEAKIVRTATEELQAAFKIAFPGQVLPNVQNSTTSQQTSTGEQGTTQTSPVETSTPVGTPGVSDTGRTPDNEVNSTVEASNVTNEPWQRAPVTQQSAVDAANQWDTENRTSRADRWFEGAHVTPEARDGFTEALNNGGSSLSAHGMAKETTLTGGIKNLLEMLTNGLDMTRRNGVLDTAPLVSKAGEGMVGATASGSAYSDGPFILVARSGERLAGNLSGLGAILINQEHAGIAREIADAIHAIRPDIIVETYSGAGRVAQELNSNQQATTPATPLPDAIGATQSVTQAVPASQPVEKVAPSTGKWEVSGIDIENDIPVTPRTFNNEKEAKAYVAEAGKRGDVEFSIKEVKKETEVTKEAPALDKVSSKIQYSELDNELSHQYDFWLTDEDAPPVVNDSIEAFLQDVLKNKDVFADSVIRKADLLLKKYKITSESIDEAPSSAVTSEQAEQPAVGEATTVVEKEATTSSAVQDGKLQAVNGTVSETTAYKQRNLAHYFTQIAGSIKDGSLRPLVAVKDFITWLGKDVTKAVEYVKHLIDSDSLTVEQIRILELFASKSTKWQELIQKELIQKTGTSEAFKYEDMMQFFMNNNGENAAVDLEENLKTAMSYAVFNYVINEAGEYPYFKIDEINKLLNRDKDHLVTPEERKVFHHKMMTINDVQNELGKTVFKALGFQVSKNAPMDIQPRLESAFGVHVMGLMEQLKLVTVETIPYELWNKFKNKKEGSTEFAIDEVAEATSNTYIKDKVVNTVRLNRISSIVDEKEVFEHTPLTTEITEANKDSKGILDKLFTLEPGVRNPSLNPIPVKKTKPSRSTQGIPALLKKSLELTQASARKIDETRMDLLIKLGDDIVMEIGGVDNEAEGSKAHISNRDGNKAKNDALRKEWGMLREFVEGTLYKAKQGKDTPFYLEFDAWIMQRVGIKTQAGNPLSSKIARGVIYSPKWEAKIMMNDLKSFKLRVLEGLGAKTDRKANTKSILEFDETFNSSSEEPKVKAKADKLNAAINAIIASFSGELTEDQKQAILIGSKEGGEKMHSFAALVEMAKYRVARKEGKKHFTTRMMGEMDGVTSGIMLSTLLYGAGQDVTAMFNRLNKGGIYRANEPSAYNIWRGLPGHKDQYESFAFILESFLGKAEGNARLTAIYGFIGSLTTNGNVTSQWRNFIKPAINAIAFGSGTATVTERLGEAMIETYYASIEKAFANNDEAAAETIINNINQLLIGDFQLKKMSLAELMETPLSYVQTKMVKESFGKVFAEPIELAMDSEFSDYVKKRNAVVQTSTVAFTIYNALKKSIRDAYIKELIAEHEKDPTKGIATNKERGIVVPIHDLTQEQEDEVTKRMHGIIPLVHTAMSKRDGDKNTGILLAKPKSGVVYSEVNHSKVKYITGDKGIVNTYSSRRTETNVGVSVLSKLLHAFDSAIMQQAIIEFGGHTFSAHDAGGTGIDTVDALGTTLNKYLWNELMNYSPAMEVYNMYALMLKTLADNIDTIPKETLIAIRNDLETSQTFKDARVGFVSTFIENTLTDIKKTADQSDVMKYKTLAVTAVVNQYSGETGIYTPTDEQRAEAALKAKQSNANAGTPQNILDASTTIGKVLNALPPREVIVSTTTEVIPDVDLNTKFNLSNADAITTLSKDPKKGFAFIIGQLKNLPNKDLDAFIALQPAKDKAKLIAKLNAFIIKPAIDNTNNWGGIGKPRREPEPKLLNALMTAKDKTVNAKELLAIVKEGYKNSTKITATQKLFYNSLINAINAALPAKLSVTLITKETDPFKVDAKEGAKGAPAGAAGWYDPLTDGIGHVYLLGPDFIKSEVNGVIVLHELLHGALLWATHRASTHANHKSAGLIKTLETILSVAREYVKNNEEFKTKGYTFKTELANIDELISYGLTNQLFQREVLDKIVMPAEGKGKYSLINGMRAFVDAVTDYFFGGKATTAQQRSGMAELIYSASALLSEQAKTITESNNEKFVPFDAKAPSTSGGFTTSEIHAALNEGKVTQGFTDHLDGLLDNIVTKLHGTFGSLKDHIAQSQASDPMDVWLEAIQTGQAPFASELGGLPITMSQQESFVAEQIEATVRTATDSQDSAIKFAYKRLDRLYKETKARLTAADFAGGQDEYDAIFKEETGQDGKSNYLSRFAALGLANQQLNRLLHVPTSLKAEKKQKKDVSAWIQNIFESILEFFTSRITHTPAGEAANVMLETLVKQLVNIENKRREQLKAKSFMDNVLPSMEKGAKFVTDGLLNKVGQAARSNYVRNHKNAFVKAGGALVDTIASDRVDFLLNEITKFHDSQFKGKQGLMGDLFAYTRGAKPMFQALLRTLKHHEGERKNLNTNTAEFIKDSFNEPLAKEESAGITASIMRTGAHNLLGHFGLEEIHNLLSDPVALAAAVSTFESKIAKYGKLTKYYLNQANATAAQTALGGARSEFTMLNAHNIANLYETGQQKHLANINVKQAEEELKVLITLYAIGYTKGAHKKNASTVFSKELLRGGKNGVEFVMMMHKELEAQSLKQLFNDNPILMQHGYTPEIYNPHTEVVSATVDQGQDLILQGYEKGEQVPTDPADPDKEVKHLYVMKGRGLPRRVSGFISNTGLSTKGSVKHTGFTNPQYADGLRNAVLQATITQNKQAAIQRLFQAKPGADLSKVNTTYAVPVFNDVGIAKNYRYMMKESTKDTLLERSNDIDKVLGKFASSIYDKVSSKEHNVSAIAALHEEWDTGRLTSPNAYITIGPKSADPELRDMWNLLSEATKQEVQRVWGKDELLVRGDAKNIIFGYQKYELAKLFTKENRNYFENMFVGFVEVMLEEYAKGVLHKTDDDAKNYARRAAMNVAKSQRAWQELVQITKDNIVVKTVTVLIGNFFSNGTQLYLSGVPLKDIAQGHLTAFRGAMSYFRESKELAKYQALLDTGYIQGNKAEIESKIVMLKNSIARNPVRELIDAGMMPTIVEDIAAEEDPYSYKTAFMKDVDKYTAKLNPTVLSTTKTILLAHDTPIYMGLSRLTQISDFAARYTLYQHLTTRKNEPMSKQTALQESSEAFVNYDIPMPKELQFMDDMGFMIFTKYFFSIQRQIMKLTKEHPMRVLLTIAVDNFINLGPTVLQGSFISHFGNNPFGMGILALPRSVTQIATINSAMALID